MGIIRWSKKYWFDRRRRITKMTFPIIVGIFCRVRNSWVREILKNNLKYLIATIFATGNDKAMVLIPGHNEYQALVSVPLRKLIYCSQERPCHHFFHFFTFRGFAFEFSDLISKWEPWEYKTLEQSGLQAAVRIDNVPRTTVERSIPLRDQIFAQPSSPAVKFISSIKIIIFYIDS